MSNREKSIILKECLLTIGIHSPQLTRFIHRSIEMDKRCERSRKKADDLIKDLDRMEAELFLILAR